MPIHNTPFDRACEMIERHTGSDMPEPIAARLVTVLEVLTRKPETIIDRERTLALVVALGSDFSGDHVKVAALINDLAGIDPAYRQERKAILTKAWGFRLIPDVAPFVFPHPERPVRLVHEAIAATERDVAALPPDGPISDLVEAVAAELTRCTAAGLASHETVPRLQPLGREAFQLMGSIRGMVAVCWKAAARDAKCAEMRRDMIDKAWHSIGDNRGVCAA